MLPLLLRSGSLKFIGRSPRDIGATNAAASSSSIIMQAFSSAVDNSSSSSSSSSFAAWRVEALADGSFQGREQTVSLSVDDSSEAGGSNLIRVTHSALNYKDALSASGNRGVTRQYPHTPGVDAAGTIIVDDDNNTTEKQQVIVTGYDLGMNRDGGFGEYIRVPAGWCVPNPFPEARTAMVYGTAGLTAGLCVQKILLAGATPSDGVVAVTGASGSVGSVAVELLSNLGFSVTAISGKDGTQLLELGATQVVGRETLTPGSSKKRPMLKPMFAHAVDTVGGPPLAELLKVIAPGGSVACCGMVAGMELPTTVLPFILRGVNLLGVDSAEIPVAQKAAVWSKLANEWACPKTIASAKSIGRHELDLHLKAFLQGASSGKIVLDHSATKK